MPKELSYNYVESGIVLNINNYEDIQKVKIKPADMALHKGALQYVLEHFDLYKEVPKSSVLEASHPELDMSAKGAASLDYFIDQYHKQFVYRQSRLAIESSSEDLINKPEQAISSLINKLSGIVAQNDENIMVYDAGALDRLDAYAQRLAKRKDSKLGMLGIPTPLKTLNRMGVGFQPGELTSLYARPTVGKTWFTLKCAATAVKRGYKVIYVTLEMPAEQANMRFDVVLGNMLGYKFSHKKIRRGEEYDTPEAQAEFISKYQEFLTKLNQSNLLVTQHVGLNRLTLAEIYGMVRRHNPDLVIVDGIYLLAAEGSDRNRARWEQNDNIFAGLKNLAMSNNIPVICSTQATRTAANLFKPPKLDQVANGDALIRASDMAFTMSKVEFNDQQRFLYYQKYRDDDDSDLEKSILKWDVDSGDIQEIFPEETGTKGGNSKGNTADF